MSTKREIKYDAADDVKLNDEVNVDLEDKHHAVSYTHLRAHET